MIYTVIGAIILILALILLLILFIPFHISFYLNKNEKDIRGNFKVSWLRIRLFKTNIPPKKKDKQEKPENKEEGQKTKFTIDNIFMLLNKFTAAFDYLLPVLCAFLNSVKLERLSLNLNLGFISPVNTALFSGYFWSVSSVLNIIPTLNLTITPDFQKPRYDGCFNFKLNLTLYRIFWASLKALTKKPVRELLWCIRKFSQKNGGN